MHKKISIIIPTLNEEKYIPNLLTDLQHSTLIPFEIIVVDGMSKDKTKEVVKKYRNVTFVQMHPGVADQRDKGGHIATGDILYFLDADVRVSRDFLSTTSKQFAKRDAEIACPIYLPYRSNVIIFLTYLFYSTLFILSQFIIPSGAGSCIIIKRKIYQKENGFQHTFKFDDIELVRRFSKKYRFAMLTKPIYVSDRRFKKEGTAKMFLTYIILSWYFVTNNFKASNNVEYQFGKFWK